MNFEFYYKHVHPSVGVGLFTKNKIPKGTVIGVFQSRQPTVKELEEDGPHLISYDATDKRMMIDHFKYINHSLDRFNVVIYDTCEIETTRDIDANEQILSSYGEDWHYENINTIIELEG